MRTPSMRPMKVKFETAEQEKAFRRWAQGEIKQDPKQVEKMRKNMQEARKIKTVSTKTKQKA